MSREDVARHIAEALSTPTEITAEDLSPPVCRWCGDVLGPEDDIVVWEKPIRGDDDRIVRERYCSEECKQEHRRAIIDDQEFELHGEPERINTDRGSYE